MATLEYDSDEQNIPEDEYEKTLEMYRQLQQQMQDEFDDKYKEEMAKLQPILLQLVTYVNDHTTDLSFKSYECDLDSETRNNIFEGIAKYYTDENVVNDKILFAWKTLVLNMIHNNRKYKSDVADIKLSETETNMLIEVNKGVFRVCIQDTENSKVPPRHICYVKNNGDNYYLSG